MLVSTTVVSTRSLPAGGDPLFHRAISTTRSFSFCTTSGPSWRHSPAPYRFIVGDLLAADARELTVHKVGAHFAGQHSIAPVADMFQQHHSQDDLRDWRCRAPTGFALPLQRFPRGSF